MTATRIAEGLGDTHPCCVFFVHQSTAGSGTRCRSGGEAGGGRETTRSSLDVSWTIGTSLVALVALSELRTRSLQDGEGGDNLGRDLKDDR